MKWNPISIARTLEILVQEIDTRMRGLLARLPAELLGVDTGVPLQIAVFSDSTRPSPGNAGRVIFNTTDGQLNIDDGTNWTLPDGTTT